MTATPVAINTLPALPRDQEGPVFNEPWQAQAFALAVRLAEAGCFTKNWASARGCRAPSGAAEETLCMALASLVCDESRIYSCHGNGTNRGLQTQSNAHTVC
jgi:hypothetical protein